MTDEDKWTLITQLATALQDRGRQLEEANKECRRLNEMIHFDEHVWMEKLAELEHSEAENARLRTLAASIPLCPTCSGLTIRKANFAEG